MCKFCSGVTPKEIQSLPKEEREKFLSKHNLSVSLAEIKRIRQAIHDGRLWELIELRARSHPRLLEALCRLRVYGDYLEKNSPVTKGKGILYFGSSGLARPEVVRHRLKMHTNYVKPVKKEVLILLPQTQTKPFHKSHYFRTLWKRIVRQIGKAVSKLHVCFYAAPFGVVPIELDETFPLSQYELSSLDRETIDYVATQVREYLLRQRYDTVILYENQSIWGEAISNACKGACKETGTRLLKSSERGLWSREVFDALSKIVKIAVREK